MIYTESFNDYDSWFAAVQRYSGTITTKESGSQTAYNASSKVIGEWIVSEDNPNANQAYGWIETAQEDIRFGVVAHGVNIVENSMITNFQPLDL